MYSDIGGKPCLIEEIGTLGPMICDDNIAADYAGTALFSAWAHDLRSFQWWCAYDQNLLEHAPYEWKAIERRLGLFEADRTPKPVVEKYSEFRKFLESTPALPPRKKDAVCILSSGQDHWGAAFSTFILAKQAGFDIEFQYIEQTLKNSPFYILPCIETADSIPGRKWHELLGKVQKGATLYMSMGNGIVEPFNGPLGIELQTSQQRKAPFGYSFDGVSFRSCSRRKINIKNISAEVIGRENDGNPVFIRNKYGKGQIYFIAAPIEQEASETPGAFHEEDAQPLHLIYRKISEGLLNERLLNKDCIYAGITEHHLSENEFAAVLTNYSSSTRTVKTLTAEGWKITEFVYGPKADNGVFEMPGNSTAVFNVKRTS
jgi:hypothetical protein